MLFTSESVTEGHPDKIADQISDAILDSILAQDPQGRVACETLVNTGLVLISGEITTNCYIDLQEIARKKIVEIGYDHGDMHFDGRSCAILTAIDEQSPDIAQGVNETQNHTQGAGDQGMMFGYAVRETPELMPLPISLAHRLAQQLTKARKQKHLPYLRPDGKTQVTIEYKNGKPIRAHTIVISAQHAPLISQEQTREDLIQHIARPIADEWIDSKTIFHINPTGSFIIGGPQGDCGLTGRKTIVDTYGGMGRHGGGAFSGKDPSKVDRTGAYMARYIAKNLVANGYAEKCEVQLSYAIGVSEPVSVYIDTFGTGRQTQKELEHLVRNRFPLTPKGIIQHFDLLRPIYSPFAAYGHFGRTNPQAPWEQVLNI